jgi:anti-sigma factor RsiW
MEITKNVILDLLPMYLAGEVSADTRTLVEKYLETDPELAQMVKEAAKNGILNDVPVPLLKENAMEAYKEAKKWMVIRTLGLTAIIVAFLFTIMLVVPLVFLVFVR